MKKRYRFIGAILAVVVLCSFTIGGFDSVIKLSKDKKQKKQLEEFRKGGIEQKWTRTFKKADLLIAVKKYDGAKYQFGGISKNGMDCSGLIYAAMQDIGVKVPHQSLELARFGSIVASKKKLKAGDLVFFKGDKRIINHVGVMISNSEFVHMSSSKGYSTSNIYTDYYWPERFLFGTR